VGITGKDHKESVLETGFGEEETYKKFVAAKGQGGLLHMALCICHPPRDMLADLLAAGRYRLFCSSGCWISTLGRHGWVFGVRMALERGDWVLGHR
jgi:hypothetical protein